MAVEACRHQERLDFFLVALKVTTGNYELRLFLLRRRLLCVCNLRHSGQLCCETHDHRNDAIQAVNDGRGGNNVLGREEWNRGHREGEVVWGGAFCRGENC